MEANYSTAPPVDALGISRSRLLLTDVFSLYRNQFPRWFAITAPTSLLAAGVLWMADQQIRAIYRSISPLEMKYHPGVLAAAIALRFGSYFISWLLGCFAFAGIATVVNDLDSEDVDSVWRRDCHQRAREHFGGLVLAALFTFGSFGAGMAIEGLVISSVIRLVGWSHFARFNYAVSFVGAVVVASIVCWLGMSIPLIVAGNLGVWAALKKSVELSNGYEGALFWLVVQSVAGSFVAWYATYYGLRLLVPTDLRHTLWYGWLVYIAAVLASAAVEPPLFIGFSLLANPDQLKTSALPRP